MSNELNFEQLAQVVGGYQETDLSERIFQRPDLPGPYRKYVVKPNDTFSGIAWNFGIPEATLRAYNPEIENIDLIRVDQMIRIPTI